LLMLFLLVVCVRVLHADSTLDRNLSNELSAWHKTHLVRRFYHLTNLGLLTRRARASHILSSQM